MNLAFLQLFLQGVLGYSPLSAALATMPAGVLLMLLSTRFGRLAGRLGARRFLVVGPLLMGVGLLYLVRVPSTSAAWQATPSDLASLVPSAGYLVDVLPGQLVFAIGLSILVAPLSTALMASVADAPGGSRVRDQQRGVAGRGAARGGAAVHRGQRRLLPGTRVAGARARHVSTAFREAVQPLTTPDPARERRWWPPRPRRPRRASTSRWRSRRPCWRRVRPSTGSGCETRVAPPNDHRAAG